MMMVVPVVVVVMMVAVVPVLLLRRRCSVPLVVVGRLSVLRGAAIVLLLLLLLLVVVVAKEATAAVLLLLLMVPLELVLEGVGGHGARDAAEDLAHHGVVAELAAQEGAARAAGDGRQEAPLAVRALGTGRVLRAIALVVFLRRRRPRVRGRAGVVGLGVIRVSRRWPRRVLPLVLVRGCQVCGLVVGALARGSGGILRLRILRLGILRLLWLLVSLILLALRRRIVVALSGHDFSRMRRVVGCGKREVSFKRGVCFWLRALCDVGWRRFAVCNLVVRSCGGGREEK